MFIHIDVDETIYTEQQPNGRSIITCPKLELTEPTTTIRSRGNPKQVYINTVSNQRATPNRRTWHIILRFGQREASTIQLAVARIRARCQRSTFPRTLLRQLWHHVPPPCKWRQNLLE
jgi:hypothetical protein